MIGDDIEVKIVSYDKDGIRIGIEAPKEMAIYRKEIYLEILEENQKAVTVNKEKLNELSELFRDLGKKN